MDKAWITPSAAVQRAAQGFREHHRRHGVTLTLESNIAHFKGERGPDLLRTETSPISCGWALPGTCPAGIAQRVDQVVVDPPVEVEKGDVLFAGHLGLGRRSEKYC